MSVRLDEARIRLLNINGGIQPTVNNTYNLGTSSLKWANVYATTFHGALDGNANTATALTTSDGSSSQPIYFSNGKPVAVTLQSTCNNLLNALDVGSSTPIDADYYISQYVGGGTTTTTYHRRPMSVLYSYIKGKAEGTWNININGNATTASKLTPIETNDTASSSATWRRLWMCWTDNTTGRPAYDDRFAVQTSTGTLKAPIFSGSLTGNATTATKLTSSAGSSTQPIYFSDGKPVAITGTINNNSASADRILYKSNHTEAASGTTGSSPTEGLLYTNGLFLTGTYNDSSTPVSYGNIINIAGYGTGQLLCQWQGSDNVAGHLYYRSHRDTSTGGWSPWITILDSSNYNSYSPTLTGTGASGTWNINISGNATTATKLATARKIALTGSVTGSGTFDGSGNLSIATTTNHNHSLILDSGNSNSTTFAYSKAGLNYSDYTWLAAWNGYELRGVNKSQFAQASHTHKYAGSSSAGGSATSAVKLDTATAGSTTQPVYFSGGKPIAITGTIANSTSGNAATATKLQTARKINSVSFNGSADITFKGNYVSNTAYHTIPVGISYIEMPSTATVAGDPTYGTMLSVFLNTARAFQLVGDNSGNLFARGLHSGNSSDAGTGYGPWRRMLHDGNYTNYCATKNHTHTTLPSHYLGDTSGPYIYTDANHNFMVRAGSSTGYAWLNMNSDGHLYVGGYQVLTTAGGYLNGQLISRSVNGGTWINGTHSASFVVDAATTASASSYYQAWYSGKTQQGAWSLGALSGDESLYFVYGTDNDYNAGTNSTASTHIDSDGKVYGAVWNDYAEYRSQTEELKPGHVAYCDNDGKLKQTTSRLQKFEGVVSDTFGFAIGETEEAKTPLAVSGRVLVYTYEDRNTFNSGDCVCAGPNGRVCKMTREEIAYYPDRIVGIVSEIPEYDTWGTGNVDVDGRIWIKIR